MSGATTLMERLFYRWNRYINEQVTRHNCRAVEFDREQYIDDEKDELGRKIKVPKEKQTIVKICRLKEKEPQPVEETEELPPSEKLKRKKERERTARDKERLRAKERWRAQLTKPPV